MASRRLRIKAVANLPVRRGRGTASDQPKNESEEDKKWEGGDNLTSTNVTDTLNNSETKESDKLEKEVTVLKIDNPLGVIHENSLTNCTTDRTLSNSNAQAQESNQSSSNINDDTIEKVSLGDTNCDSSSSVNTMGIGIFKTAESQETDKVEPNTNIGSINKVESASMQDQLPPKFARKRMRPTVTLSAAIKRPRKVELISDLKNNEDSLTTLQADHHQDQLNVVNNSNQDEMKEDPSLVRPEPESFCQVARVVGVPEPTQLIPTGTAIRPQQVVTAGDDLTASPPLESNGEDAQLLPEPDLPSEGACGDVMPKVSTMNRLRFVRPSPRIPDPCVRKVGAMRRLSETDDSSRRTGMMPTLCGSPIRSYIEANKAKLRSSPKVPDLLLGGSGDQVDHGLKPVALTPGMSESSETMRELESEEENRVSTLAGDSSIEFSPDGKSVGKRKKSETLIRRGTSKLRQRMLLAQKEFSTKFGNRAPDRSRLTMFDLIYYNPCTNPMKSVEKLKTEIKPTIEMKPSTELITSSENTKPVESGMSNSLVEERLLEENVDDAGLDDHTKEEFKEEEITLAVPQVKVGPDGQIIIDEKSLVIETTGAKKSREELANSTVVVEYGTGSGTYGRKSKKSRCDWTKQETLKFYRALNTIGTDFLLMQSIFPNRTRQDLKVKFKREDRINRELVEKALRNPLDFDLTDLEKDLVKEQEEELAREKLKMTKKLMTRVPKPKKERPKRNKSKSFASRSMATTCEGSKIDLDLQQLCQKGESEWGQQLVSSVLTSANNTTALAGESSHADQHLDGDTDDDGEAAFLLKEPRPTKSGRIPMRNKYLVNTEEASRMAVSHAEELVLPDLASMEPGSLVVLSTPSPDNPNEMIYKVFMVPPAQVQIVPMGDPLDLNATQETQVVLDLQQF